MQAAMKVVNDSLQKSSTKNVKNQLKNATSIIQQEWFRISSVQTANPLDVEDYLDAFDEVSSALLEYIVNMTDSSVRIFIIKFSYRILLLTIFFFRVTPLCITQFPMEILMLFQYY